MTLPAGTRIGAYEISEQIGEGGMGQVFRATDTRLKRQVALKILPPAFAADSERLARFQREAEVLASLNHPHIAAIYGLEESDGVAALVMELVDGEDLSRRIARGAIPMDEALPIARQIADALEAAHDQGVIHRDLKPANIKLRGDGSVKVLDFGLAKAMEPAGRGVAGAGSPPSMSPTMMSPGMMTGAGLILGTAGYMSPEQARGKPVDRRADIWAFGCVLYEMLAGRPLFATGETASDAIAAVLTRDPDWRALPPDVPVSIRTLIRRCLQKDPNLRLHHIADARIEIDEAMSGRSDPIGASAVPARQPASWNRALPWVLAALALPVAVWSVWRPTGDGAVGISAVRRLELNLPANVELFSASSRTVAVSPDGSRVAFVGTLRGNRQVYVRPLDHFEATPLRGTDAATACFFSPDGQAVGVITSAGIVRTVSLSDGLVTTSIGDVSSVYGAAWTADEQIVFVRAGALWRIPRAGGTAQPLTTLGGERKDTLHAWPLIVADGTAMVFAAASGDRWRIDALVLATGERRTVVDQGTLPLYAGKYLVFFRDGELLAAPFDAATLQLTGPPVQAASELPDGVAGAPVVDLSASGTLVYAPTTAVSRLVWVSRQGVEQPLNDTVRNYVNPRLSSDANRVVVQAGDLWVQDLERATFTRLAPRDAMTNAFPAWANDGRRVLYRTARGLKVVDTDGNSEGQAIPNTSEFDYPGSFSPDGETLVFIRSSTETSFDVMALSLRNPAKIQPLVNTSAYEGGARFSPDGRWLIYVSSESGRNEVYLRPFAGTARRWQVSTEGGTQAVWNPNGKEIVYRNGDAMVAVEISTSPEVKLSPPRVLFEGRYAYGGGITISNFDISRDGQRFIMVKDESTSGRLNIVLNWFSDLARMAPVTGR